MDYDVIIIGSGSAGSILATRLTEDSDRSVLLLEAGPDYPTLEELPEEVRLGYATEADIARVEALDVEGVMRRPIARVWRHEGTRD